MSSAETAALIVALSTLTFALRAGGVLLGARVHIGLAATDALTAGAIAGLVAAATFQHGTHFALDARPAGVVVAVVVARLRAPLPVAVVCAAATVALLRAW